MIYYTSSILSSKLAINLPRWKRWVRDFLPPDPLGGKQSGYARQLSLKEAFIVFFGGYLISELHFSVPEAGNILFDLSPWLKKKGYYNLHPHNGTAFDFSSDNPKVFFIEIFTLPNIGFNYVIREMASAAEQDDTGLTIDHYTKTLVGTDIDPRSDGKTFCFRSVVISELYSDFIKRVLA